MPSFNALKGKFFGNTIGTAAGVAAGSSTARALDPILQDLTNATWEAHPHVPPDAYAMAQGLAQGQVGKSTAYKYAAQQGIGTAQMDALVAVANVGPALGYAFEAWRRVNPATGTTYLSDGEFQTAMKRTGLEPQWFDALKALKPRLLDPADLARGIHKGLIPDPGLLATPAPSGSGKVPAYPVYPIDALQAAEGYGYSKDDLGVLVGLQGNPMGAHEAAQAVFRGVLEPVDYDRAIAEGNTRNEWGEAIFEQSRQIPTVIEGVENAIRGYSQLSDAIALGARHGMTAADVTLIYQNAGRPMTPHQITIGLARGGRFHPIPGEITDPYEASAHESSVKPSYQELYISAGKYGYPPLFQLNQLVKGQAITADIAKDWATKDGYAPEVVDVLYKFWQGEQSGSGAAGAKPKQYTYSQIHQAWRNAVFTDTEALSELEGLGYSAAKATTLLNTWKATPPSGG